MTAREVVAAWEAEGLGWAPGMEHTNWPAAWADLRAAVERDVGTSEEEVARLDAAHEPYEDVGGGWACTCGRRQNSLDDGFVRHVLTEAGGGRE